MEMMTDALNLYISHCEVEWGKGNMALSGMKKIAREVKSLLHASIEKTSDN